MGLYYEAKEFYSRAISLRITYLNLIFSMVLLLESAVKVWGYWLAPEWRYLP
jgi:hypothetical protein